MPYALQQSRLSRSFALPENSFEMRSGVYVTGQGIGFAVGCWSDGAAVAETAQAVLDKISP